MSRPRFVHQRPYPVAMNLYRQRIETYYLTCSPTRQPTIFLQPLAHPPNRLHEMRPWAAAVAIARSPLASPRHSGPTPRTAEPLAHLQHVHTPTKCKAPCILTRSRPIIYTHPLRVQALSHRRPWPTDCRMIRVGYSVQGLYCLLLKQAPVVCRCDRGTGAGTSCVGVPCRGGHWGGRSWLRAFQMRRAAAVAC